MRWLLSITILVLVVGLALCLPEGPALADDGAPPAAPAVEEGAPDVEALAKAVMEGGAAQRMLVGAQAITFDEPTMQRFLAALQAHTRTTPRRSAGLRSKRVKGLAFEETTLDQAAVYLGTITGLRFHLAPQVRERHAETVRINLRLDDVPVAVVLDLITEPHGLCWREDRGVIWLLTSEEAMTPGVVADAEARLFRVELAEQRVSFTIEETPLDDVFKTLSIMSGQNVLVQEKAALATREAVLTLSVDNLPLSNVLDLVTEPHGLTWHVVSRVIVIDVAKD